MPDNDVVNKALADAKSTLAATDHWPKISSAPAPTTHPQASYSAARDARGTGSSINYNLKQKQAANTALSDVGVK